MNRKAIISIIEKVFERCNDDLFIEASTNLGYDDYFRELPALKGMSNTELSICYSRVIEVCDVVYDYQNKPKISLVDSILFLNFV